MENNNVKDLNREVHKLTNNNHERRNAIVPGSEQEKRIHALNNNHKRRNAIVQRQRASTQLNTYQD